MYIFTYVCKQCFKVLPAKIGAPKKGHMFILWIFVFTLTWLVLQFSSTMLNYLILAHEKNILCSDGFGGTWEMVKRSSHFLYFSQQNHKIYMKFVETVNLHNHLSKYKNY